MNQVTIGTHHIYYPKTMTADQTKALNLMIDGIQKDDANLGKIGDNDTMKVTETWTDSSGVQHT